MSSLFDVIPLAPRDPILGVTEAFNADPRSDKVNLGVGVYYDDQGRIPVLDSVRSAEAALVAQGLPRGYQPIDGLPAYVRAVQELV
ncbi:MAG: aminotransferase class I/II-fold pyridoxal phosphate-dependent enzyme, partial [Pseudomonadales bacterium]